MHIDLELKRLLAPVLVKHGHATIRDLGPQAHPEALVRNLAVRGIELQRRPPVAGVSEAQAAADPHPRQSMDRSPTDAAGVQRGVESRLLGRGHEAQGLVRTRPSRHGPLEPLPVDLEPLPVDGDEGCGTARSGSARA